jgi:hypothetical protein
MLNIHFQHSNSHAATMMTTISLISSVMFRHASKLPLAGFKPRREQIQRVKSSANEATSTPVLTQSVV